MRRFKIGPSVVERGLLIQGTPREPRHTQESLSPSANVGRLGRKPRCRLAALSESRGFRIKPFANPTNLSRLKSELAELGHIKHVANLANLAKLTNLIGIVSRSALNSDKPTAHRLPP